eukprot:10758216-Alexandrium_andersonii.AAC.1
MIPAPSATGCAVAEVRRAAGGRRCKRSRGCDVDLYQLARRDRREFRLEDCVREGILGLGPHRWA